MTEVLEYIRQEMALLGIPYEFMLWTAPVSYPYCVGEFSEIDPLTEDGLQEKIMILTLTTINEWLELLEIQEKLEENFPSEEGKTAILDDGSGIAVFYGTALPIPTGDANLKRLQVNLNIKLWKVKRNVRK